MTRFMRYAVLLACLLGSAAGAAAQDRGRAAQRPAQEGAPALAPAEVLNMLDAYAVVQAQRALELPDEQYGEFIARLKRLQVTRRRSLQARNAILRDLRRLTAPEAAPNNDGEIQERLKALRDLDDRTAGEMQKAYDAVDELLSPRQRARFRLFEDNLERRKLDLLMRARRAAARGGQ